jgi:hypothetical protein
MNPTASSATAKVDTWLKKTEQAGGSLPANEKRHATSGMTLYFGVAAESADASYWMVALAAP